MNTKDIRPLAGVRVLELGNYIAARAEMVKRADELFALIQAKKLSVRIGATFPLAKVGDAHRALEGRGTTGKVLLVP